MKKILAVFCVALATLFPGCKKEINRSNQTDLQSPSTSSARTSGISRLIWQKCLGSTGNDDGLSMAVAKDPATTTASGYFLVGTVGANNGDGTGNHGLTDGWVSKRDFSGALLWQLSIGGTGYDNGKGVVATQDGGALVAIDGRSIDGDFTSLGSSQGVVIVKVSNEGKIVWEQRYGVRTPNAIIETSDGGVAITGYISAPGAVDPQESMFLLKLNPDPAAVGDQPYVITLDKTYGYPTGTHGESGYGLCETGAGFALVGVSYSGVNSDPRFYVVATDATGTETNHALFSDGVPDIGWGITKAPDGDLVTTGRMGSNMVIFKLGISNLQTPVWQKSYTGNRTNTISGFSVVCTGQDCIITGSATGGKGDIVSASGGEDLIVAKLALLDGAPEGNYSIGGTGNDRGRCIIPAADGTNAFMAFGYTNSNNGSISGNHGGQDMWLVKVNAP